MSCQATTGVEKRLENLGITQTCLGRSIAPVAADTASSDSSSYTRGLAGIFYDSDDHMQEWLVSLLDAPQDWLRKLSHVLPVTSSPMWLATGHRDI